MRGNEKMEKRKDVKRKVESVTFLVLESVHEIVNTTLPDSLGSSADWLYSSACRQQVFSTYNKGV